MTLQNGVSGFETPNEPTDAAVNGTGNLAPETEATSNLAVVPPSGTDEQPPSIDTLQTRIADLEAQAQKRENDYKALEGRLRNATSSPAGLDVLTDKVDTLTDTLGAFIRHQGTQDQEAFAEDLQRVEADARIRRATNDFDRASEQITGEMTQLVEQYGIDLVNAPEFANFRAMWTPAHEGKNLGGIYQAHSEFNRVMRQIEQARYQSQQDAIKKEADERLRKELEAAGINSLESDTASIPSALNGNSLMSRIGNPEVAVSRDELLQARDHLFKDGIRS
tara:strand:+ start:7447 stop:8283 length:837 start_codon:yes stop_codon:yes gene_type:complete